MSVGPQTHARQNSRASRFLTGFLVQQAGDEGGWDAVAFWIGGLEVMQPGVEVGWGWGAEGLQACWAAVGVRTGLQQGMLDL